MQEALRLLDPVAVDQDADHPDAEGVHQHGQRHGREHQHRLVPERPAVEDGEEIGEAEDREEIAQPRAGLGHLELVDAEVDHVAVEIDRDSGEGDDPDPDLRRDRLEHDVHLPVDDLRQGQHEDQVQHRKLVQAPAFPAEDGQHHAADPDDHRIGDDVGDPRHVAEDGEREGEGHHHEARPAGAGRPRRNRRRLAQFAQEEIERDDRDQRPVAVFRRGPGHGQRDEPDPEDRHRGRHQQHEPEESRGIDRRQGKLVEFLRRRHGPSKPSAFHRCPVRWAHLPTNARK